MKQLTIGVVGLGYWGPNIVRNLLKHPAVSQIYGCDQQSDKRESVKVLFPQVKLVDDYSLMLQEKTIDAVIVATPIKTHFALAKMALEAKKHVLVEKPITKTTQEAKKLIKIAKSTGKMLMVGHTFVYSEAVKRIKQVVTNRELGKLFYFESTRINVINLELMQKDSNVIWDLAPHDLAILGHIFSEKPVTVTVHASSFVLNKQEEAAHIFIDFEKGIHAHLHVGWISPVKVRTIAIGGSKRMVVYDDIEPSEKIKIYDNGSFLPKDSVTPFTPAYRGGDVIIPRLEQIEPLYSELSHFINCIMNGNKPLTGGLEGMQVVRLLEAIDQSLISHKQIML